MFENTTYIPGYTVDERLLELEGFKKLRFGQRSSELNMDLLTGRRKVKDEHSRIMNIYKTKCHAWVLDNGMLVITVHNVDTPVVHWREVKSSEKMYMPL